MSGFYPNHDRRLRCRDKSDPMPEDNLSRIKFPSGLFRDNSHLVFRHLTMGFIFNPRDFPALLQNAHRAPKINNRPRGGIVPQRRQIQGGFSQ